MIDALGWPAGPVWLTAGASVGPYPPPSTPPSGSSPALELRWMLSGAAVAVALLALSVAAVLVRQRFVAWRENGPLRSAQRARWRQGSASRRRCGPSAASELKSRHPDRRQPVFLQSGAPAVGVRGRHVPSGPMNGQVNRPPGHKFAANAVNRTEAATSQAYALASPSPTGGATDAAHPTRRGSSWTRRRP
jgi:hypothetical protein